MIFDKQRKWNKIKKNKKRKKGKLFGFDFDEIITFD